MFPLFFQEKSPVIPLVLWKMVFTVGYEDVVLDNIRIVSEFREQKEPVDIPQNGFNLGASLASFRRSGRWF